MSLQDLKFRLPGWRARQERARRQLEAEAEAQEGPELTNGAYRRWLRAQRPQPLTFFLGLSEDDQEALASLGDEYTLGLIDDASGPVEPAGGTSEDPKDLVRRLAAETLREMGGRRSSPIPRDPAPAASMSGAVGSPTVETKKNGSGPKSFLGRKPDEEEPAE